MKVGIYRLYTCCRNKNRLIACGKNPCSSIAMQVFLMIGLVGFIMMFSVWNYPPVVLAPLIVVILIYASCYMNLCMSEPGVAPEIIKKWKQVSTEEAAAREEHLLANDASIEEEKDPLRYMWRVCLECQQRYNLTEDECLTCVEPSHCVNCNVCILEMDHHCPLFNRCIAKNNLRNFYVVIFGYPLLWLVVGLALRPLMLD